MSNSHQGEISRRRLLQGAAGLSGLVLSGSVGWSGRAKADHNLLKRAGA
ncbi:MAG: twin-arginine translocation signal domain-containing protein [Thermoguttaceae bacterium]|nr:twin-arginine translocation signal domain-containing protein [Thermoguttaceae bacterium]